VTVNTPVSRLNHLNTRCAGLLCATRATTSAAVLLESLQIGSMTVT